MAKLTLGVVVPTYNRSALLLSVVTSVLEDRAVDQVVVVNDGSTDATEEVCASLSAQHARVLVIHQDNAGEGAARAAGVRASTCDIVLLLDDDVLASQGLGAAHLAYHERGPKRLVVLGSMDIVRGRPRRRGQFPALLYQQDYERMCQRYISDQREILDNLWAGNFSARREVLLDAVEVPTWLPYHQDQVLGWNLRSLGCRAIFDPELRATHCYERSGDAFFREAARKGSAKAMLAQLYQGAPSTPPLDDIGPGVRSVLRIIAGTSSCDAILRKTLLPGCGACHLWRLEGRVARALALIVAERAFDAELSGAARSHRSRTEEQ